MKKSVILAVIGLSLGAGASYGQGSMTFNSCLANNSAGVPVIFSGGGKVGAGYVADLLYSLTPITDSAGDGPLTPG